MAPMGSRPEAALEFGGFRLDPSGGRLLQGDQPVALPPKAFSVLQFLAARPGQLVSKQELLSALWTDVFVGDAVLKVAIREVRKALGDDPHAPRFIETAHRRGYRFIADVRRCPGATSPPPPGTSPPPVHYAHGSDVSIAYQVLGSGPVDLVFVMGWVSHLEYFWKEPRFARFLSRLSGMARLILFDKRGTGLSDPVPVSQLPTLDQRLDDVRAVMSAVGSERAVLMGVSEGGPLCTLFSATYPEKTEALVMIGSYARRFEAPDYPWGQTREDATAFCRSILDNWGGPVGLEARAPSLAADREFRDWWAAYLRMGASPGAALALTLMNSQIDVRDVLPTVRVPTLVLHRRGDRCLPVEGGRYLASRIPGARFVELAGDDHLPFVGDQDEMLREIETFLSHAHERSPAEHALATVLAVISEDGAHLADLERAFAQEVSAYRGEIVASAASSGANGVTLTAAFDGPSRAVRCGRAVSEIAGRLRIPIRSAVHIGEFAASGSSRLVEATLRIAAAAPDGDVLVSRTVVDLVPGSGLEFAARGAVTVGSPDRDVAVFAVSS